MIDSLPNRGRIVAMLLALLVVGCVDDAGGGSDEPTRTGLQRDRRLSIDGVERLFDVYAPVGHGATPGPAPLVILLHGQGSSKEDLTGGSRSVAPYGQWQRIADANDILLMIPQGAAGENGRAGWNDCRLDASGNPETDDVSFLMSAIDQVAETHLVDPERIFAVGTSNGGHMAVRLAQEAPERLAGIGVVAAGMPVNSECDAAETPVSALFMWGTDDPIAPYDGGAMAGNRGEILSADDSIRYWIDRNGVSATPEVTAFADIDSSDRSTVERFIHRDGLDDTAVALYRVNGGGHTEPSVAAPYRRFFLRLVGPQNHDIEMATEVWAFFENT